MADYNRNQGGSNRNSNQDWNENRNRSSRSDSDYDNTSENQNYGNFRNSGQGSGDSGWQSRYEREGDDYGRYSDYNRNSGRNRQWESGYDANNYTSDRNYGSDYNSMNQGDMGNSSWNRDRNLYDRDYQGINRSGYSNSGTRMGGSNYGSYGDRDRSYYEGRSTSRNYGGYSGTNYGGNYGSNYGSNYGGSAGNYSGNYSGSGNDYNRGNYGNVSQRDRNSNDRNWWDRTSDEVASWFGDEDAERRRNRDRSMGEHRGKGPKSYTRSDDRIKEDINDKLSDDPFIDATDMDVTVSNGEVTLTGNVDHRSTKRRAEDLAESVSGVKNVENRIRVSPTTTSSYESSNRAPMTSGMSSATSGTSGVGSSSSTRTSSETEGSTTSAVPGSDRNKKKDYVTG